eukprot:g3768.t1
MKSFCSATLLLVAVLVISTEAAFPERTLLQSGCGRACSAVRRTDSNTIQEVIREGNNICDCICNRVGSRILHMAVFSRCHECARAVVSEPSSCPRDTTDPFGNTALHTVAGICRLGMDEELIRMGFPVDLPNRGGNTPLCIAAAVNDPNCGQVVRLLIAAGARRCFRCSDGRTPCQRCVNDNVCNVLRQDGACNCP